MKLDQKSIPIMFLIGKIKSNGMKIDGEKNSKSINKLKHM